jgi:hypothetical protein
VRAVSVCLSFLRVLCELCGQIVKAVSHELWAVSQTRRAKILRAL